MQSLRWQKPPDRAFHVSVLSMSGAQEVSAAPAWVSVCSMSGVLVLQLYTAANAGETAGEVRALLNYLQSQALAWQRCKVAVIGSR